MKANSLTLVRFTCNKYDFRLLWNGRAMLDWNAQGFETSDIPKNAHVTAYMLHLLGTEASAACTACGYKADEVPTIEELEEYLTNDPLYMPWEQTDIVTAIADALHYGNHREQRDGEDNRLDLDTIELKKN